MALNPEISLGIRPPQIAPLQLQTPLDRYQKMLTLRHLMDQQQIGQQQLQSGALDLQTKQLGLQTARQAVTDDEVLRKAYLDVGDDLDRLPSAVAGKVSGQTMLNLRKLVTEQKSARAKMSTDQLTNLQKQNELIRDEGQALISLKPEERPAAYLAARERLKAAGIPETAMPPEYDERFALGAINRGMQDTAWLKKEQDRREELLKIVPNKAEAWPAWHASLPDEYRAVISPKYSDEEYQRVRQIDAKRLATQAGDVEQAEYIIAGIEAGDLPPTTQGLYRHGARVKAGLARDKYDLATAQLDWGATQRHLASLNNPQQLRFRQVVTQIGATTDQVEALFNRWKQLGLATGYKDFNKLTLEAAKHFPGEMGSVASNLEALLADYTAELGQVYMGGNSPTDHGLKLAEKNLRGEWNDQTFGDALKRIRESIHIRENSLKHTGVAGLSGTTSYGAQPTAPPPAAVPPPPPKPQSLVEGVVNRANAPAAAQTPRQAAYPGAPPIGQTEYDVNGVPHRYIGGDHRDAKNWLVVHETPK